ncbi:hypothetical protein MRX96_006764 [Rhipicephalus microplus]
MCTSPGRDIRLENGAQRCCALNLTHLEQGRSRGLGTSAHVKPGPTHTVRSFGQRKHGPRLGRCHGVGRFHSELALHAHKACLKVSRRQKPLLYDGRVRAHVHFNVSESD